MQTGQYIKLIATRNGKLIDEQLCCVVYVIPSINSTTVEVRSERGSFPKQPYIWPGCIIMATLGGNQNQSKSKINRSFILVDDQIISEEPTISLHYQTKKFNNATDDRKTK